MTKIAATADYKRGLTIRSVLGILYAAIVVQPAVIWVFMATGLPILGAAVYASILVFSELAAYGGKPLTEQEILMFLMTTGMAVAGVFFGPTAIFNLYFRRHPLVASYGIADSIPTWVSPPVESPAWDLRTFFHPDWIQPLLLSMGLIPLGFMANLALGFLTRALYVEHEKLPFPMAHVSAELCSTLAERNRSRLRIMLVSTVLAMGYSIFQYAIPTISEAAIQRRISIIPQPWIDLNRYVELFWPGGSFGIGTDLAIIGFGIILPPIVSVSIFIGSFAIFFVGNGILTRLGLFPEWTPDMNVQNAWQRSVLRFWAAPTIALSIVAGVVPLIFHPKPLVNAFRSLARLRSASKSGSISLRMILVLFLTGSVGYTIVGTILIPDFPFWILLILNVGWVLAINLIGARAVGITGISMNVRYVREGAILASGYPATQYEIWFLPTLVPAQDPEGVGWCSNFKVAELTETYPMDLVKGGLVALVFGLSFGFLYTQMFWTIAPIPSSLFPAPFWDMNITMTTLFMTRQVSVFDPTWMGATFLMGIALQILMEFAHIPISVIGIAAGANWPIPYAAGIIIGLTITKVLGRFFGKKWVEEQKATMLAGVLTGQGLIVAFSAGVAMLLKAVWIKPF